MSKRDEFINEMASICISRCSMNQASLQVVRSWRDWGDLFDAGYRNAGDAFREWLRCS